jgi:uncharacterized membrane protein YbaN (DUF454 family)
LRSSADALVKEVISLVYFMRGSIQYDDMFMKTYYERKQIEEFLESRLEIESKKMFAVY